jgi:hypothetical protein
VTDQVSHPYETTAKNNAELQTKWIKTTWKTFEDTIRWGQNRSDGDKTTGKIIAVYI